MTMSKCVHEEAKKEAANRRHHAGALGHAGHRRPDQQAYFCPDQAEKDQITTDGRFRFGFTKSSVVLFIPGLTVKTPKQVQRSVKLWPSKSGRSPTRTSS